MKRLFITLFTIITSYVIYIDLTQGTLPNDYTQEEEQLVETITKPQLSLPSFEAEVEPGETLISIVEQKIKKPLPVSIDVLIEDFQKLNPGQSPEKIQIGASYQFPDYSK
jgi:hypothetical protein